MFVSPTVATVLAYRRHVDAAVCRLVTRGDETVRFLVTLGLHHEQQHDGQQVLQQQDADDDLPGTLMMQHGGGQQLQADDGTGEGQCRRYIECGKGFQTKGQCQNVTQYCGHYYLA